MPPVRGTRRWKELVPRTKKNQPFFLRKVSPFLGLYCFRSLRPELCFVFLGPLIVMWLWCCLFDVFGHRRRLVAGWWNHESAPFKFTQDYMEIMGGPQSDKWER